MEAERRSTMSSLKGQLSNVEGSVKTMKAAVVVGSVLTVACLAAVFGVTIAANEISKEVKVSNGSLVAKNGSGVATTSTYVTEKADMSANTFSFELNGAKVTARVNAIYSTMTENYFIADDCVLSNGVVKINPESLLGSVTGTVEKRNLSGAACAMAYYYCIMIASIIGKVVHWTLTQMLNWIAENRWLIYYAASFVAGSME